MKKRLSLIIVLIICASLCLTSCTSATDTPNTPETPETPKTPDTPNGTEPIGDLEFVTGQANGGWFSLGAAIADKTNAYFKGFPITAVTGGGIGNPQVMGNGDAEIGMTYGIFLKMAEQGSAPYESPITNLRSIAAMESLAIYFIVDKNVDEDTLGGLINSGTKVDVGSLDASAASYLIQDLILKEYGLNGVQDLQKPGENVYIADGSSLYDSYKDRHFNLLITMKAVPDASTVELLNGRESTILSLEEDMVDLLVEKYDWSKLVIPAGTYSGQDEDVLTIGIKNVLCCVEDVPDDVAYYLAKTVYEEKEYFETVSPSWKKFSAEELVEGCAIDMHPGAEKYWREAGLIE